MNLCMIGHGMMGVWHSEALAAQSRYCLVGRRPEPTAEFAARYGYRRWTVDLDEALADPAVDAVIVGNPSELHAQTALRCLAHGKPTLVEIPIAMSYPESERVVLEAERRGLPLGVVHPMRFRRERAELRERLAAGEEHIRHIHGRFFIHRLKNIGATGYHRSWIDNLLWHHTTHLLDLGLWMLAVEGSPVRSVSSFMPAPDPRTGIPMEVVLLVETEADQSLLCSGSYYSRERMYDTMIVTDRDSYRPADPGEHPDHKRRHAAHRERAGELHALHGRLRGRAGRGASSRGDRPFRAAHHAHPPGRAGPLGRRARAPVAAGPAAGGR